MSFKPRTRAAFFDVDNTLLNIKSMLSFQQYYFKQTGGGDAAYETFLAGLMTNAPAHDRQTLNRLFYQSFAGRRCSKLRALAWRWFETLRVEQGAGLWIRPVVVLAETLRAEGYQLVAVSGSCYEILAPPIHHLRFDDCLATRLEVDGDVYTGRIESIQMIGAGKGEAVRRYAQERGMALRDCVACGDHISDLAMLELVGRVWTVAGDPELEDLAAARSWPVLNFDDSQSHSEETALI